MFSLRIWWKIRPAGLVFWPAGNQSQIAVGIARKQVGRPLGIARFTADLVEHARPLAQR